MTYWEILISIFLSHPLAGENVVSTYRLRGCSSDGSGGNSLITVWPSAAGNHSDTKLGPSLMFSIFMMKKSLKCSAKSVLSKSNVDRDCTHCLGLSTELIA